MKKRETKKREKKNMESDAAIRSRVISSPHARRRNTCSHGKKERGDRAVVAAHLLYCYSILLLSYYNNCREQHTTALLL
ncbi:hypothetical protein GW17_00009904 [Ensete ventricosum]|nr:hypothetical protein GW17_00009904 [Ensete ventricosum]